MSKDFTLYQEALELKELGFDEPCFGLYAPPSKTIFLHHYGLLSAKEQVLAPTYSQAFRWFRKKYNIDSWIQPFTSKKSNGVLYLPDESYSYFIFKDGVWVDDKVDFLEPEEAELECLKKLIQIVKENKQ